MKKLAMLTMAVSALLVFSTAPAATSGLWIHVAVDEHGPDGSVVRVNVPLELVTKVLPLLHHESLSGGKVTNHGRWKGHTDAGRGAGLQDFAARNVGAML